MNYSLFESDLTVLIVVWIAFPMLFILISMHCELIAGEYSEPLTV